MERNTKTSSKMKYQLAKEKDTLFSHRKKQKYGFDSELTWLIHLLEHHTVQSINGKFCTARDQGTKHYVKECQGTASVFEGWNRDTVFKFVQEL